MVDINMLTETPTALLVQYNVFTHFMARNTHV